MIKRLNVRFLAYVAVTLVVLVGAVGGVIWYSQGASVERLVAEGDDLMARGNPNAAISRYGMALNREIGNRELTVKYLDAVAQARPQNNQEARRYFEQLYEWSRRMTDMFPMDMQLLERHYSLMVDLAERVDPFYYQQLQAQADLRLERDPANPVARRYRGIAHANRLSEDMDQAIVLQTLDDLELALERDPQDPQVLFNLARWNLFEATRLRDNRARPERYMPFVAAALDAIDLLVRQDPQDLQRRVYELQILTHPLIGDLPRALDTVNLMTQALLEEEENDQAVVMLAEMLPRLKPDTMEHPVTGRPMRQGILEVEQLLENAVQGNPQLLIYRLLLAENLRRQGRHQEAMEVLDDRADDDWRPQTVAAMRHMVLTLQAAAMRGRLLYELARQPANQAQRAALMRRLETTLTHLEETAPQGRNTPAVNELRGKHYALQGRMDAAVVYIDRASSQARDANPELLLLSANIRRGLGEVGAARDRMMQLMNLFPQYLPGRLQLARDHLAAGDFLRAQAEVQRVLEQEAGHREALALQAGILAAQGETDQAIARMEQLQAGEDPVLFMDYVRLLQRAGQVDRAREILQWRVAEAPADLNSLLALMAVTPSRQERMEALDAARRAGAPAAQLDRLERLLASDQPIDLDEEVAALTDPVTRVLAQAELAMRRGELPQALALLEEAQKQAPQEPRILQQRFRLLLAMNEWLEAERLARQAAEMNLDQAQGGFWRARLSASRGRLDQAIAEYQQALAVYPVYSEGHRELGQVYLMANNFPAAAERFRTAMQQRPNDLDALRGLASALDRMGQHDQALEAIGRAYRFAPQNQELFDLYVQYEQTHGDRQRAIGLRRQIARNQPDNHDNRRRLAVMLAQAGEYDQADQTLEALVEVQGWGRENVASFAQLRLIERQPQQAIERVGAYIRQRGEQVDYQDYLLQARTLNQAGQAQEAGEVYRLAMTLEPRPQMPVSREVADAAFAAGQLEQARVLYEAILQSSPQDRPVRQRLIETSIRLDNLDQAQQLLAEVDHEDATYSMLASLLTQKRGDSDQALQMLGQAIRRYPEDARLYHARARLLASEPATLTQAMSDVRNALSRNPDLDDARQLLVQIYLERGEVELAVRELRHLLTRQPDSHPLRLQLLNLYINRRDLDAARRLVDVALERQPQEVLWPLWQSRIARLGQDNARAIEWLQQAVALQPTPDILAELVTLLLDQGQARQAHETLRDYGAIVNQQPVLRAMRGRALATLGQREEAESVLVNAALAAESFRQADVIVGQMRQALGTDGTYTLLDEQLPQWNSQWRQLLLAQLDLQREAPHKALERLQGIQLPPRTDAQMRRVHGRSIALSHYNIGSYSETEKSYRQLLEAFPEDLATMNDLAWLLVRDMNQPRQAYDVAQRAARIAPDLPEVLDTLGYIQLQLGVLEEARQTLERSVAIRASGPNHLYLAMVEQRAGNVMLADQLIQRAVSMLENQRDLELLEQARSLATQWREAN